MHPQEGFTPCYRLDTIFDLLLFLGGGLGGLGEALSPGRVMILKEEMKAFPRAAPCPLALHTHITILL